MLGKLPNPEEIDNKYFKPELIKMMASCQEHVVSQHGKSFDDIVKVCEKLEEHIFTRVVEDGCMIDGCLYIGHLLSKTLAMIEQAIDVRQEQLKELLIKVKNENTTSTT